MRKFFWGLVIVVLFLGVDALIARALKPHAPNTKEAIRQAGVDVLAKFLAEGLKVKLHLPQRVDDITTLEDITSDGDKVIYSLSFNADSAQFNLITANITNDLHANGCDRPDYRKFLSFGLTIVLDLHIPTGAHAPPIVFTPQSCGL